MNYLLTGEETERLHFRLLEPADFNDWLPLFFKEEAAKFLGLDPTKSPSELCQHWFDKAFHRYENNLGGMNVLEDKYTGEMIGQSGLLIQEKDGKEFLEVGYSILPKYWGKGYATEAAVKCKNYAFENNIEDKLFSVIHIDNIASQKVALKNKMCLFWESITYKDILVNFYKINKNTD
ncbi:MAG: GNAT family N-acetyltransferase [Flavobacteriales bacterium]|jgi:RimJ/RimL family protein N-acetyltransferase|nr:GNAT family N-acetyltransferase [Flavobacteriales bacterium]